MIQRFDQHKRQKQLKINYSPKTPLRVFSMNPALIIILFMTIILSACGGEKEEERPEKPENVQILPEVIFAVTDDQPLNFVLDTRGIVEPVKELPIIPRVSGFLTNHSISDGKTISRGETLFAFDDAEWRIGLQEAEVNFERARQEYELEYRQRLNSFGKAHNEVDSLDTFDDRLLKNQTGYTQAKTALDRIKMELTYTTMKAPFSGEIFTERVLTNGSYLSAGQELGLLIDYSTIRIRFDVLESEIGHIQKGMEVDVRSSGGYEVKGNVVAISPRVDRARKTGQVIVQSRNSERRLKPGMSVDGRIFIDSSQGKVRAPRAALLHRDNRALVFKLNGTQVEWIYVEPQAITSDWIILNEPNINPGDTLAVDRHFAISHLQEVRPRIR